MAKLMIALLACGFIAVASALPTPVKKGRFFGTLIVGGEDAAQGELPFQLSLRYYGYHICGASLAVVNGTQVIITATHCMQGGNPPEFTVVGGAISQSENSGREQTRQVIKINTHMAYGHFGYENDIAVLFIYEDFEINEDVAPISLPTFEQQTSGDILVSGWGTLSSGGDEPDILQKVQIPIVEDAACAEAYVDEYFVESMLCAGLPEGGKDSCQGDSGGPLRAIDGDYLAGIVSWGYGCAAPGYPGVNTEVSYFMKWIEGKVAEHNAGN